MVMPTRRRTRNSPNKKDRVDDSSDCVPWWNILAAQTSNLEHPIDFTNFTKSTNLNNHLCLSYFFVLSTYGHSLCSGTSPTDEFPMKPRHHWSARRESTHTFS